MNDSIPNRIAEAGGRAFLVGGTVRDQILGKPAKDIDIEVHGLSADNLVNVLSEFGNVDAVGASFGVLKLTVGDDDFDFSLPRRENKVGRGHKGFQVEVDPAMTTREAARRRDFTMNAMMFDILDDELVDHFGGIHDLETKTLRMVDAETFVEDPLRVLRGFQFAGRFGLTVEPETARVCAEMVGEFDALSIERVWTEFEKWAAKSVFPSDGLRFLRTVGWLNLFPEVARLVGVKQDSRWHPEGDVFEHTCQVVDWCRREAHVNGLTHEQTVVLVFAGLCHDFGKPDTTTLTNGRVTSHGHEKAGMPLVKSFLKRIGAPRWLIEQVVPLVENHMFRADPTPRNVRRLAQRVSPSNVEMLVHLMNADHARKPAQPKQAQFVPTAQTRCSRCHRPLTAPDSVARGVGPVCAGKVWTPQSVLDVARDLECADQQVKPLLMGRHLLPFMAPGPQMGQVLRAAFEAQVDGVFSTVPDGVAWVQARL